MLRQASNADLPEIVRLATDCLAEFGYAPDFATSEADLVDLEATYGGAFFVVEEDGCLLATGGVLPVSDGTFKVRKMYVHREARGRGQGRMMLSRLVEEARARGARRVVLETTEAMTAAQRMYERFGFRVVSGTPTSPRCDRVYELDLR
ncbi:MAG: GNAT family N-acetyltransferase [Fimbriimonas sp.]